MKNFIFESIHETYHAAYQDCVERNVDINYPVEIWKKRQLEYLTQASHKAPRSESITKVIKCNRIDQIVDYGGGSGWLFRYLANTGYEVNSRIVVETDDSIIWFREFNPDVVWMSSSSLMNLFVQENSSVLYSNSCIQYLGDFNVEFEDILSLPWTFIVLDDIPHLDGRDLWTRQQYYDFNVPYHFFDLKSLIAYIESMGYKILEQAEYCENYPENWQYKIKNAESSISPRTSSSLIFRRLDSNYS